MHQFVSYRFALRSQVLLHSEGTEHTCETILEESFTPVLGNIEKAFALTALGKGMT